MKKYAGWVEGDGRVVVNVIDGADARPLDARLSFLNKSPTGFNWGYGGSGPAQLAFALLADALDDDERALDLYLAFKWHTVADWPQGERWTITQEQILAAAKALEEAIAYVGAQP